MALCALGLYERRCSGDGHGAMTLAWAGDHRGERFVGGVALAADRVLNAGLHQALRVADREVLSDSPLRRHLCGLYRVEFFTSTGASPVKALDEDR